MNVNTGKKCTAGARGACHICWACRRGILLRRADQMTVCFCRLTEYTVIFHLVSGRVQPARRECACSESQPAMCPLELRCTGQRDVNVYREGYLLILWPPEKCPACIAAT
jgi:hypothetical protein